MRRESRMPPGAKADDSWIRNPRCIPARDDGMSKLSYNRKEAAEYLGISLYKLDEHKRLGHICPRYDGSVPLYPKEELDAFFASLPSEPKSA